MRVALVNVTTTTKIGGVETFVWQLARCLTERGITTTIFGGACADSATFVQINGLPVVATPYLDRERLRRVPLLSRQYGATKLLERVSHGATAARQIIAGDFDIIHIHKPFDFALAAWLRHRTPARVVYSSHGRDFYAGDRRLLGAIDAFTACSGYNAVEVRERYHRDAHVIYNGIDTDRFAPRPADPSWRASLGAANVPLALWVGRLERWKGTIDALRAIALSNRPIHLAIAGTGPEEHRLRDAAIALGISDRIHLLGAVQHEDLPRLYASSDVVVGTSFANETFGMAIAEASACARPVIATRFGGFPEVVRENASGLLVPPRDPLALARAMERMLDDRQAAAGMGACGRAYVVDTFAWPVVTERVLGVYREVLA